jgi:hypothetical protein
MIPACVLRAEDSMNLAPPTSQARKKQKDTSSPSNTDSAPGRRRSRCRRFRTCSTV